MAHVLLPCELPYWPDVLSQLTQLRKCQDGSQVTRIMSEIFETSWVSLDPEDAQHREDARDRPHEGLVALGKFIDLSLTPEERTRFLKDTLLEMADRAAQLKMVKPPAGFLYSLRAQDHTFHLERRFVASLLANAFFSTFPRRNSKTHPTLQDFRMAEFFTHLDRRGHQKKLKAFLRYFESLCNVPDGQVKFTRRVLSGPSLPGWLCSDRPLVPLVVRPKTSVRDIEDGVYRACFCSPLIGGDTWKTSTAKEAKLFFTFPELLVILCFVETLTDEEAFIAEPIDQTNYPVGFCFLDAWNASTSDLNCQFEDRILLRELNKNLAAFSHEPPDTRSVSSASKSREDNSQTNSSSSASPQSLSRSSNSSEHSSSHKKAVPKLSEKKLSTQSSWLSMRTASQSSVPPAKDDDYFTADEESEEGSMSRPLTEEISAASSSGHGGGSCGFVLGESEDSSLPKYERLDDFRKRVRKRTRRRLSRRRSSSSYISSSDMEDISEEDEHHNSVLLRGLRSASSEPSLIALYDESMCSSAVLSEAAETAMLSFRGRLLVTSSNGHLKAYSYDGVNPNLPVPFKAKFRRRERHHSAEGNVFSRLESSSFTPSPPKSRQPSLVPSTTHSMSASECIHRRLPICVEAPTVEEPGDSELRMTILWLAASMADAQALIMCTDERSKITEVYRKVLSRDWTVGDLSCEVLRFCRNKLHPRRKSQAARLFGQLLGREDSFDFD